MGELLDNRCKTEHYKVPSEETRENRTPDPARLPVVLKARVAQVLKWLLV